VVEVRPLTSLAELREAVRLQREIWAFADAELVPVRLFVVATKIGGEVLGAFDGARMVGFSISLPGVKSGGSAYLHSHMVGVVEDYRNAGVGRQLKLAQRDAALARGIGLIEWTFDPLEIKNAYFNLERLGAIVRRYVPNQYGITASPLHGGLPTDRCVAEWWLASERVKAIVSGQRPRAAVVEERVSIPADIAELRVSDSRRAREVQLRAGEQLESCFARGLAVIGFERSEQAGTYLLGPWASE
jgi:predicted GNAT superfamily acetyltransferase